MYTNLDKAIVALVMSAVGVVGVVWHPLSISPEAVSTAVGILTPVLVYFWPNAPKG
jgi:hypothetical protein